MLIDLTIEPACSAWSARVRTPPEGELFGHPLAAWRAKTRRELALAEDRPVIATGHQSMLWHAGILVKYILTHAVAAAHDLATANLVVDQHAAGAGASDFGAYEVPVRRPDGSLGVRRLELTRPRAEVPMALHEPFDPAPSPPGVVPALPSVARGIERIHDAIGAHRDAATAGLQMAGALADLMKPWAVVSPHVTASDLVETALARAIMAAMVEDPRRCAMAYNAAVAAVPEGGIAPLLVRDDWVEMPLWRLRADGRRMHAYDNDVERWLEGGPEAPRLLPRALLMTALIRLGMCDLFVHGRGGARYDGAMERWIETWLGVKPGPVAVASATIHLPFAEPASPRRSVPEAVAAARRVWHDPEPLAAGGSTPPGSAKRELLSAVDAAPRRSPRRRQAFLSMHRQLEMLRSAHVGRVERLQREEQEARRQRADHRVAGRRDWAFPLHPPASLDALAAAVAERVQVSCQGPR